MVTWGEEVEGRRLRGLRSEVGRDEGERSSPGQVYFVTWIIVSPIRRGDIQASFSRIISFAAVRVKRVLFSRGTSRSLDIYMMMLVLVRCPKILR